MKITDITEALVSEISKATLGRYVKANAEDQLQRASSASFQSGQAGDKYNKADASAKDKKRQQGMDRAVGKLTKEGMHDNHKAAIKGMHQLSGDQYYGLYKFGNDVAGHDGDKQTGSKADDEVSDKPFAYAYTDAEEKMIKGADPKAKKITSSKSEEATESIDADQKRAGQVPGEEKAKNISKVIDQAPKKHPFDGRLVGG